MITEHCRTWSVPSFRLPETLRVLSALFVAFSASACTVEAEPSESKQPQETSFTDQALSVGVEREDFSNRFCCQAEIASCKACQAGVSIQQYCAWYPHTVGCRRPPQTACDYRDPARRYVARSQEQCSRIRFQCTPDTTPFFDECGCGCEAETPRACCEALTASCMACSAGMTIEQYCLRYPRTQGCTFCTHSAQCGLREYCTTEDGACLRKPGTHLTVCYGLCSSSNR